MKILLALGLAATLPIFAGANYNGKPVDEQIVQECREKAAAECKDKKPLRKQVQCVDSVRMSCIQEKMTSQPE